MDPPGGAVIMSGLPSAPSTGRPCASNTMPPGPMEPPGGTMLPTVPAPPAPAPAPPATMSGLPSAPSTGLPFLSRMAPPGPIEPPGGKRGSVARIGLPSAPSTGLPFLSRTMPALPLAAPPTLARRKLSDWYGSFIRYLSRFLA